jgi:hypothetical protein
VKAKRVLLVVTVLQAELVLMGRTVVTALVAVQVQKAIKVVRVL